MEMLERINPEDKEEVLNEIERTYGDNETFEFSDNLRVAWIGDNEAIEEYSDREQQGCCGSFETKLTCKSGRIYLIGFNYGH